MTEASGSYDPYKISLWSSVSLLSMSQVLRTNETLYKKLRKISIRPHDSHMTCDQQWTDANSGAVSAITQLVVVVHDASLRLRVSGMWVEAARETGVGIENFEALRLSSLQGWTPFQSAESV